MKLNIRNKLLITFAAVLVLTAIVGVVGINGLTTVSTSSTQMYENQLIGVNYAQEANKGLLYIGRALRQADIFIDDPANVATQVKLVADQQAYVGDQLNKLEPLLITTEGKAALADARQTWQAYTALVGPVVDALKASKAAEAKAALQVLATVAQPADDAFTALYTLKMSQSKTAAASNTATAQTSTYIQIGLIIVAILAGLGVAIFMSGAISSAARQMVGVADGISAGELDHVITVKSQDEMGDIARAFSRMLVYIQDMAHIANLVAQRDLTTDAKPQSEKDVLGNAFAQMIIALRESVGEVAQSAESVSAASEQLAAAAEQAGSAATQQTEATTKTSSSVEEMKRAIDGVAKGAQEQAAAVGKASAVTTQMTAAIQQVAGNAQNVTKDSASAMQAARDGAKVVAETVKGMESIKAKVGQSAAKVQEMGQRSTEIGAIVETIEDIASQTNLLALNAAIEAARAGEHGKGFAVVADEVRKLAERAGAATKEIATLIRGIQQTVTDAVAAMKEGTQEVELGTQRANEAGQVLTTILKAAEAVNQQAEAAYTATQQMGALSNNLVSATDSVSAVVEENTASTEEMAAGAAEVTGAIESIASVSEEMNAQVEEVAASATSLSELAQGLQQIVTRFKLSGNGHAALASLAPAKGLTAPREAAKPQGRRTADRPA